MRRSVEDIIQSELSVPATRCTPEAKLIQDLGCDSLDLVTIVMAVEDEFDIEISDKDIPGIVTVADIKRLVATGRPA